MTTEIKNRPVMTFNHGDCVAQLWDNSEEKDKSRLSITFGSVWRYNGSSGTANSIKPRHLADMPKLIELISSFMAKGPEKWAISPAKAPDYHMDDGDDE